MQKTPPLSPEQTVADLAHLAWCALVALRLARQGGQALSLMMTHTFLLRWLASAQKQRRFPKSVAPDIESLLQLGRKNGQAAKLKARLDYLWESCSSPVTRQSDLFRLTYAFEALKAGGWQNVSLPQEEWQADRLMSEFAKSPAVILVSKSALTQAFTDEGTLHGQVNFLIKGEHSQFIQMLASHQLSAVIREHVEKWAIVTLEPAAKPAQGEPIP